MRRLNTYLGFALVGAVAFLTACSNGGTLNLEPGARKVVSKGSPFVQVNQGGKALIVEQGQTAATGVHGYVTVQTITAKNLSGGVGQPQIILNKAQAQASQH
jgi:hypothetical protein